MITVPTDNTTIHSLQDMEGKRFVLNQNLGKDWILA